jgi:hypothetical protein
MTSLSTWSFSSSFNPEPTATARKAAEHRTSNIEHPTSNGTKRTAAISRLVMTALLVAVAGASARAADKAPEPLSVDKEKKTVSIACKIAPRKLPNLAEIYPIEVIASHPAPKGQKAHETVVTFDVKPSDIHKALESLGLKAGKPAKGEGAAASGPEVKVFLELPSAEGVAKRIPIEKALVDKKTGKTMPNLKWLFTGSIMKQVDPTKDDKTYAADVSGTLIAVFPVTDEAVLQTNLTMKDEPLLKLETNTKVLPAEGTAATLILQVP